MPSVEAAIRGEPEIIDFQLTIGNRKSAMQTSAGSRDKIVALSPYRFGRKRKGYQSPKVDAVSYMVNGNG